MDLSFLQGNPILAALGAGIFLWFATALGAACILFVNRVNKGVMNGLLGGASGVMIGAVYWSLLAPAVGMVRGMGASAWIVPVTGFLLGGGLIGCIDKILPHLHPSRNHAGGQTEGLPVRWRRSVLLMTAITLHNIPEGLAVGVALGAAASGLEGVSMGGALVLALGITLHSMPEGLAVAVPLRREGMGRKKAFLYGQASALVMPVATVAGAAAVVAVEAVLPYALPFAAGAMVYVVVEELIPAAKEDCEGGDVGTIGAMAGFALMMALEIALG